MRRTRKDQKEEKNRNLTVKDTNSKIYRRNSTVNTEISGQVFAS